VNRFFETLLFTQASHHEAELLFEHMNNITFKWHLPDEFGRLRQAYNLASFTTDVL